MKCLGRLAWICYADKARSWECETVIPCTPSAKIKAVLGFFGLESLNKFIFNPLSSPGFVARRRRRAWIQGARREDSAGVLDSTSRNPTERNAVDMPGCAAAVELW